MHIEVKIVNPMEVVPEVDDVLVSECGDLFVFTDIGENGKFKACLLDFYTREVEYSGTDIVENIIHDLKMQIVKNMKIEVEI